MQESLLIREMQRSLLRDMAQGNTMSPHLFNIFITALLRLLMLTAQNENFSHGLLIID